jgi:glycerol-3-phosphate cytidylyltransferase
MLESKKYKKGVIAGNFDIIHPGYIKMFKECKENSEEFIILLHTDPSIERPEKLKPILSVEERDEILMSIKYIDNIFTYTTENDLIELLKLLKPDVRFLGDDYKEKKFTGCDLNIPIYYLDRSHGWSTTKFKNLIAQSL